MNILALEPYHGGSHKAFLDGWQQHSRHAWTVLGLNPNKWKWRMRHAAVTFAAEIGKRVAKGEQWDLVFCSDMLNLAEFLGLTRDALHGCPAVAYFHENQLTYPFQHPDERDYQFVFTNITTALAANAVWFNSQYHLDEFLAALPAFYRQMPDYRPHETVAQIRQKSSVQPQGIAALVARPPRPPGPIRILWAARWEYDKDPDMFFEALRLLRARGLAFRLHVLGQQFRQSPPVFAQAEQEFKAQIDTWGYQPSRAAYRAVLARADVAVSTAQHEFFGIGIAEAAVAGAFPLVPRRLAYPEVLAADEPGHDRFFYEGGAPELADALAHLARKLEHGDLWDGDPELARRIVQRYTWPELAPRLDAALETAAANPG